MFDELFKELGLGKELGAKELNIEELVKAMAAINEACPKLCEINDEGIFTALIGAVIDTWISAHGKTSTDRMNMIVDIFCLPFMADIDKKSKS